MRETNNCFAAYESANWFGFGCCVQMPILAGALPHIMKKIAKINLNLKLLNNVLNFQKTKSI